METHGSVTQLLLGLLLLQELLLVLILSFTSSKKKASTSTSSSFATIGNTNTSITGTTESEKSE